MVAAKGSGRDCCCGGCYTPPRTDLAQTERQPLRHFCCACIPRQICVRYECLAEDTLVTGSFNVYHACLDAPDDQSVYRGSLPIRGEQVDVEIGFVIEDRICYLYLDAYDLGVTRDDRDYWLELDEYRRAILCRSCQKCPDVPGANDYVTWDNLPDGCTLQIRPSDLFSVRKQAPCPECCGDESCLYDDIVAGSYQAPADESAVERPCCAHCLGCSCISACACIVVMRAEIPVHVGRVCICNHRWQTDTGVAIGLRANPETLACELVIESYGEWEPVAGPATLDPVPLSEIAGNCLAMSAMWQWYIGPNIVEDSVAVLFDSTTCDDCSHVTVNCCGDEIAVGGAGQLPKILTASISSLECCSDFQVTLVYNSTDRAWIGSHATARCGGSIDLRLVCDGIGKFKLTWTAPGCVTHTVESTAAECSPVNITFAVPTQGLGCCDSADPFKNGTSLVEITE